MAILRAFLYGILVIALSVSVLAQNGSKDKQLNKGDEYFKEQKWEKAADAYQEIVSKEKDNGGMWFRLGYAQHMVGRYEKAITAYQKSFEHGVGPIALYNIACSYAKLSNKAKAIEWLTKAAEKGFAQVKTVREDEDLAILRSEKQFEKAVEMVDKNARPCAYADEYHQFDFWQGEWDVVTAEGYPAGKNTIQVIEEGCVVFEHFRWGDFSGRSFSSYDKNSKMWRQLWVDNQGKVMEFTGEYKDKKMVLTGSGYAPDGTPVERRMTLYVTGKDKVRQLVEVSTDKGKEWKTVYDLMYSRADAAQAQK